MERWELGSSVEVPLRNVESLSTPLDQFLITYRYVPTNKCTRLMCPNYRLNSGNWNEYAINMQYKILCLDNMNYIYLKWWIFFFVHALLCYVLGGGLARMAVHFQISQNYLSEAYNSVKKIETSLADLAPFFLLLLFPMNPSNLWFQSLLSRLVIWIYDLLLPLTSFNFLHRLYLL